MSSFRHSQLCTVRSRAYRRGDLYAVIGGFHLTGSDKASIIDPTVEPIQKMAPKVLVPMHCTGFEATRTFQSEFPQSFVLSSVGTKLVLPSDQWRMLHLSGSQ